jgi:hypothetical protein
MFSFARPRSLLKTPLSELLTPIAAPRPLEFAETHDASLGAPYDPTYHEPRSFVRFPGDPLCPGAAKALSRATLTGKASPIPKARLSRNGARSPIFFAFKAFASNAKASNLYPLSIPRAPREKK